jgi:squalene synthase HpnC
VPIGAFRDLLDAFSQDVTTTRYPTFPELADYCRRSANPVGRLLLHLFGEASEQARTLSDRICTALQLLNFCQDAALDWQKGRIYFPLDELRAHGVDERHFTEACVDAAWRSLFDAQLARALSLLASGSELPALLRGRARLEIRAIVAGGERIGARLAATRGDVFRRRPQLNVVDGLLIALRAAGGGRPRTRAEPVPGSPG